MISSETCGGLDESDPIGLCVRTLGQKLVELFGKNQGGSGLVGGDVALGGDFEVFKDLCPFQCVLHLLLVDQDVSFELCP